VTQDVGLPARPFLYTLDQIATLLAVELSSIKASYLYYEGRSSGIHRKDTMRTRNIAPIGEKPDWRVSEMEFTRWLRTKRFRVYERVRVRDIS
jgi:hypothetical protein